MKKITLLFLSLLVFSSGLLYATDEITFKLEKKQKLIGTFSGDINQEFSVHMIIFKDKNKDDYRIKPFFIDQNQQIKALDEVSFMEEPTIVSYHFEQESSNLSLLVSAEGEDENELHIIDINTQNNFQKRSKQPFKNSYLIVRLTDKSILINREDDNPELKLVTIKNSDTSSEVNYNFEGENLEDFETIFDKKPEVINTKEFVENGSVNESKLYFSNNKLVFDYTSEDIYKTLQLNPDKKEEPHFQNIEISGFDKVKDVNSYIYKDKSFLFINDKEDISLQSYDVNTGSKLMDNSLRKSLQNTIDKDILDDFIKDSSRNRNGLTGTVNTTEDKKMLVTIDYVDTRTYNYNYNWWFHHWFIHQQMMFQQQMMQQHQQMQMMNYGPNVSSYSDNENIYTKKEHKSIQLLIDTDFSVSTDEAKPERKKIDKEIYIKPLDDNRKIKEATLAFTQNSTRYLYYSKETDSFHIKSENLKE
ncbi:hypothetical protein [Mesonia maritima]|uniref:Uncharacterized protein n=1 Tax=Mesonia maritima TaxID=1793873 RepID=A0ABU1K6I2_9FLAO|nr:hypothetical protein [Mesonia maritima]MDR6301222.1 hypothetical protein [Mesonia maritima]